MVIWKITFTFAVSNYSIMEKLIGRVNEVNELKRCYNSARSEFVILYGRRRIGKTFLVNSVFEGNFSFYFTGSHQAENNRQLERFAQTIQKYGQLSLLPAIDNWYHAFDALQKVLEHSESKGKKVIFIDEMPWLDNGTSAGHSQFVAALEDFWNAWAALRDDILLIATGSATSWMVDKLIGNQGGLYNRITARIHLRPFNLHECEQYLREHGCAWDHYAITQYYMYMGGVPFYLSLLDYSKTVEDNIDDFFFHSGAKLDHEFDDLYHVLFRDSDAYIEIARLLANHREGMTREDILNALPTRGGGWLTKVLNNLERCDFIEGFVAYGNKKKGKIYRLTDFFTLFYLKHVESEGRKRSGRYWAHRVLSPDLKAWQGLTFELVVLMHAENLKRSLGISGMVTNESAWRSKQYLANEGQAKAQIDLIIERADRLIHLCEVKFSQEEYVITREYEAKLRNKMAIFREETKTKKPLIVTFVTTYGVKQNIHSGIVAAQITMEDLFSA